MCLWAHIGINKPQPVRLSISCLKMKSVVVIFHFVHYYKEKDKIFNEWKTRICCPSMFDMLLIYNLIRNVKSSKHHAVNNFIIPFLFNENSREMYETPMWDFWWQLFQRSRCLRDTPSGPQLNAKLQFQGLWNILHDSKH